MSKSNKSFLNEHLGCRLELTQCINVSSGDTRFDWNFFQFSLETRTEQSRSDSQHINMILSLAWDKNVIHSNIASGCLFICPAWKWRKIITDELSGQCNRNLGVSSKWMYLLGLVKSATQSQGPSSTDTWESLCYSIHSRCYTRVVQDRPAGYIGNSSS